MKNKVYAVRQGRKTGIFSTWVECEKQVKGYTGAKFKSFATVPEALVWLEEGTSSKTTGKHSQEKVNADYVVYTDGSCLRNPGGPGGWAAILTETSTGKSIELHNGESCTTNNRMELSAAVAALSHIMESSSIALYTDSQYLKNAFTKHWIKGWKRNGWKTSTGSDVKNRDLWEKLDVLFQKHQVDFHWVKGHAGIAENERCDQLAKSEAMKHGK